jgi:ABC-type uncharacterized transport system ATPase subunit
MNESLEKNNLLELKNINLTIDDNKILENISLTLEKGKIKTLIGINGGGKTTLARIIIGAVKASSGKVIKQKNIKIGHMPQKIQVDKTIPMSVIDFIKLVNYDDLDNNFHGVDLVRDLADKKIMFLRHHGMIACGKTIHEALFYCYHLELACKTQIAAFSSGAESISSNFFVIPV